MDPVGPDPTWLSVRRAFARAPFQVRVMIALSLTSVIPMVVLFSVLFMHVLGVSGEERGSLALLAASIGVLMLSGAVVIWDLSRGADRASRRWRELSLTDELTGTYNRRYCTLRLNEEIARAARYRHSLCLVLFDVDHFKEVNDRFGHRTGDEVLREVCGVIQSHSRTENALCRYGGDEFAIVLPETAWPGGLVYADRIRAIVGGSTFSHGQPVTISVGVGAFPDDAANADALVKAADTSLYSAKAGGRNRVGA
jgi:diguanylate cyclase (GGDEF)-like protein